MMRVPQKWRPSLGMITAGMIAMVVILALGGFWVVRVNVRLPAEREVVIAGVLALAGASIVGAVFVRTISTPLRELGARAESIGLGDRAAIGALHHHGTRELATVTQSFMTMAQRLSAHADYLRTFQRHVSHELKTPLAAIRGAAELMIDNETMAPPERARFLGNIAADVERMAALIERLNELSRTENPEIGASTSLDTVLAATRGRFAMLQIEAAGDLAGPVAISTDNLAIVLAHLLDNAARHGAAHVRIEAQRREGELSITVEDDGAGISAGNRDRVFDPFFTTRRAEGGTGMGLAIVRSLLAAHGGTISLADSARGARFAIVIASPAHDLQNLS